MLGYRRHKCLLHPEKETATLEPQYHEDEKGPSGEE
jgi:hypothetical protein